jgi:hypothetical protein
VRTYLVGRRSVRRRTGKGGATPLPSPLGKKAAERASEREERGGRGGEERRKGLLFFSLRKRVGLY